MTEFDLDNNVGTELPGGLTYGPSGQSKWDDLYKELKPLPKDGRWRRVTFKNKEDAIKASSAVRTWANRNLSDKKFLIKLDPEGKGNRGKPCIFVQAVDKPKS